MVDWHFLLGCTTHEVILSGSIGQDAYDLVSLAFAIRAGHYSRVLLGTVHVLLASTCECCLNRVASLYITIGCRQQTKVVVDERKSQAH